MVAPANGSVAGSVRDASGAPVPGAQIEGSGTTYLGTTVTAADGTWSYGAVPPGTYTLCASGSVGTGSAAHYATICWETATAKDTATPVVVGDRQAVTGINMVLR